MLTLKNFHDESGSTAISNFILYGYKDPKKSAKRISAKWTYMGLLAHENFRGSVPYKSTINTSQHKIAPIFQKSYNTFRDHLEYLKEINLVSIDPQSKKMCINVPKNEEVEKAFKFKISLLRNKPKKYCKSLGFTIVPNSLFYGYPELQPEAKFLYVFIKSLDWDQLDKDNKASKKGLIWYKHRKLADMAGIKYRTFKKYLKDLCSAGLIYAATKIGIHKSTWAISYNNPSKKEQKRAFLFKSFFRQMFKINRNDQNYMFEISWESLIRKPIEE